MAMGVPLPDLTGRRFGKLVVLERLADHRKYRVRCDCGRRNIAWATKLYRGLTTDCGCGRTASKRQRHAYGETCYDNARWRT